MTVEILRTFLGWGAILNLLFLSLTFFFFLCAHKLIYRIHSRWFNISQESFHTVLYAAMAWYKLATFLFFVIPYCALRFCM